MADWPPILRPGSSWTRAGFRAGANSVGWRGVRQRSAGGMVRLLVPIWASVILLFAGSAARAQTPNALAADIPSQSLAEALAACARQTGLQIVYVSEIVRGLQSKGAPAGLSPDAALARLLEGTGLRFELLNARSARIVAAAVPSPHLPPPPGSAEP